MTSALSPFFKQINKGEVSLNLGALPKIIEDDSFEKLLNKNHGKFKEMWDHQINGMIN